MTSQASMMHEEAAQRKSKMEQLYQRLNQTKAPLIVLREREASFLIAKS